MNMPVQNVIVATAVSLCAFVAAACLPDTNCLFHKIAHSSAVLGNVGSEIRMVNGRQLRTQFDAR